MSRLQERCLEVGLAVLVLAAIPALLWGWAAYTDRYGEPVQASYEGPCDRYVTRRAPLTISCDAILVGAEGGTRHGRVTDNLGEPLPAPPATVAARARGDRARTRMSGAELWAGLVAPPIAAAALPVVLVIGVPFVIGAVRDARADDAGAVPRRST